MRRGGRLPDGQAEVVVTDVFVEQVGALGRHDDKERVLAEIVRLCDAPGGKHPLTGPLAGWNTLDVLAGQQRVIYRAGEVDGVGLIEVLCLAPRSDREVYDLAEGLACSGLLDAEEIDSLWDALAILAVVEEDVGLDGWDYRPEPAPEGMVRAAVAAGLLAEDDARRLSQRELEAAMQHGWTEHGPDPHAALIAALEAARRRTGRLTLTPAQATEVLSRRDERRCGALMPRARTHCIRRAGHPGPHRSRGG